jgi:hypothetical protein
VTLEQRLAEAEKRLDERNIATKAWIQSDTQTRAYCHRLEAALKAADELAALVQDLERLEREGKPMTLKPLYTRAQDYRKAREGL